MKQFIIMIFITVSILQIGCSKSDTISSEPDPMDDAEPDPGDDENLPPSGFNFQIKENITGTEVVITWGVSKDPENELVTYSVYLDDVLKAEDLTEREIEFTDLDELTTYSVKIIAKDPQNNETVRIFSFTTIKYYLQYSKFYDFDDVFSPGGRPYSMIRASDGNYVIVGSSNRPDSNGQQFFFMKIDEEGNEIWRYFYFYQIGDAMNFKITQLSDQNFIAAAGNDILKIDNDGIEIWHKEVPGYGDGSDQSIKSIKEDSNGDLFVVGIKRSSDPNTNQAGALTKLDALGNVIWDKEFNPSSYDTFNDLVITDTNSLVILGSTIVADQNISSQDFWVVHVDNDGNMIWEKTFGEISSDFPFQIIRTQDGNYAFCGGSSDEASLYKIDTDGNVIWSNLFTQNSFFNYSLTETKSGGFAATGYNHGITVNSLTLLKYDSSGNVVWTKLISKIWTDSLGHGILQTDDEGFIVVGVNDSYGTGAKIWVIKTDPEGYFGEY